MAEEKIKHSPDTGSTILRDSYYRELIKRNFLRLALTYLAPLIILIVYFHFQYREFHEHSRHTHLQAIAEYQANTLDLFLRERIVNLRNLIDDPQFQAPPSKPAMQHYLERLQKSSDTFVDVGFFDSTGIQRGYAGHLDYLEDQDYSEESWFIDLKDDKSDFIITDIYLGFRQKPHFTIGINRIIEGQYIVLRATLDPEKFYEYIISHEKTKEVKISIVNQEGYYQIVTAHEGTPSGDSSIIPPRNQKIGIDKVVLGNNKIEYAYAWLLTADWAVIVEWVEQGIPLPVFGTQFGLTAFSFAIILLLLAIIIIRTKKIVEFQIERETTKAQFEHAAKLASVGELSAGVAHEINNPLAVISTEVGLIKDMMDPELGGSYELDDIVPHLISIDEEVFRCRDITRKLMSFVRKTEIKLMPHSVNVLIDEITDAFWKQEIAVSNIEIEKNYQDNIPEIVTDANQMKQIFLNILTNAFDAITPPGKVTITTSSDHEGHISIAFSDTGKGITPQEMDQIFMPFFTTKEVGKGTGLGLSVSYSIVRSLGGKITVESILGKGSVFTVVLPVR